MKNLLRRLSGRSAGVSPSTSPATADESALTPAQHVEAALARHRAGLLREAEALYLKALAADATHFDALHMLGVLRHHTGDSASAVALLEKAIALAPGDAIAHSNLGAAYQALNQLDQAEALFARAVQLSPSSSAALNNLGNIRKERGQLADAERLYRQAIAVDSATPEIWNNLGRVLSQTERLDDAADCFRKTLELRPGDPNALVEIGSIHAARAELPEAERYFRLALQSDDRMFEAMNNLGDVLRRLDRVDEAELYFRTALAVRPADPTALGNLAVVLLRFGAVDEAEECCRRALANHPDHVASQATLGVILNARGRLAEAEECFRRAMLLNPKAAAPRYNLAMLTLSRGDYKEGLAFYESRFDAIRQDIGCAPGVREMLRDHRVWRGEALSGKRLLIWTEQGFGDSLMMLRYLPLLKERGAGEIRVQCEPTLERVVCSIPGLQQEPICTQLARVDEYDLHCPIMSLPYLFHTTLECIPGRVPYIVVPTELRTVWKKRLLPITKTKVGLAWKGSTALRDDARRSIPLAAFQPVIRSEGTRLISLQKGEGAEQAREWPGWIEDWMDDCHDFMDTAALMCELDLVISVDSAVAHLAGALGKPVWLLNRYGSEWRWGLEGEQSPWYPSMRIFRQLDANSWEPVIARLADELTRLQQL